MPVVIEDGFCEFTYLRPMGMGKRTEEQTTTLRLSDIEGFTMTNQNGNNTGLVRTKTGNFYAINEVGYYELLDAWKEAMGT